MARHALDAPAPSTAPSRDELCGLLWDCHLSGQMSEFQLQTHLRDDDYFRAFVEHKLADFAKEEVRTGNAKATST
jgi:hypothetical protein